MTLVRKPGSAVALVAATLLVLVPFWWMASIAFKPESEVFTREPRLLPGQPTLDNFATALDAGNLDRALTNSLVVALVVVAANIAFALPAGYAFAKLPFRGSDAIFMVIVSTTMVPVAVTLIPMFLIAKGIPLAGGNDLLGRGGSGLLDSLGGLTLPHLIGPLNVFLARQYFVGLADELGEAARVDGASEFTLFWRIYLPLARPLVATVAVFSFTAVWDDFLWPLVVTSSPETQTVQLALSKFLTGGNVAYGPAMAGSVLVLLPILAVFVLNQRSFVAGLSEGGVKG
ncbi:carbohydrate ABC transporter permease [Actinomadura viridis]|uniref:Multiple sugar transport system permease protein n=1 Tax=Actinomadura viridis TaxID=58110 RepID=A0A931DC22_9ACTN|nr:carbohydrate ABC transporter permease [Actinomadura viridis]MBG6086124.1 multiple sugar transport system permease protein [Actinomadura viridis]